jgi:hypothetical protein
MYPCMQVTEAKKQGLTHIWLHATLLVTSLSQCYMTFFTFRFFKFYLPAVSSLPPCYFIRTQTYLLLFWPSSLLQVHCLYMFQSLPLITYSGSYHIL